MVEQPPQDPILYHPSLPAEMRPSTMEVPTVPATEVNEALMHDGGSFTDVSAQSHSSASAIRCSEGP